ncbi:carboxypeptidase regulatory-like domain-containing protein [Thermomonas sp.]|uniref:TonB-dependent receptor n=1 Tax=Thermomonas sp. TaxID=1971895 RepID=UPI0035B2F713
MTHPNRVRLSKLSLGLMVALAAAPVFAQSTSAGVGGQVVGADGQPVAGAEVTITHIESGTVSRATTDAAGRYNARGLRVGGPYTITINKAGAGSDTEENVYLTLNQVSTVDGQLNNDVATLGTVQAVASTVTSVFSSTKMGSGSNVDQATIEALPSIGGNIQDFMRLDPRVAFTDRASGNISAGGQNPRYNAIAIDGVSASDTFGLEGNNMTTRRQPVSMQAIEAIDIDLSNYDVTTSGAAGANVNAVTKSGTNEFHGSLYGTYRDGDWFGDYPNTGLPFGEYGAETTWGVTLGGPLIKDKLFFFANYEKFNQKSPGIDLAASPLANPNADFDAADVAEVQRIAQKYGFDAGGFETNSDTNLEEYALKLDWNINDNHRASLRYSKLDQDKVRPEGASSSTLSLSSYWYNQVKSVESYVGQLYSDWTDNFSTEFKVSFRDYSAVRVTSSTAPSIRVYFDGTVAQPSGDSIYLGTEANTQGNTLLTKTWNYYGAGTLTMGDHDVKFGFDYSDNDIFNYYGRDSWGTYTFYGLDNFENGIWSSYSLQRERMPGSIAVAYSSRNLGLFLQDTWYFNNNLTLTFGVRADRPSVSPNPPYNAEAERVWGYDSSQVFDGNFIVQPRFGFNYTFDTERQTQLRGGVGLFQGDSPQVWIGNGFGQNGMNSVSYFYDQYNASLPFSADAFDQPVPPGDPNAGTPCTSSSARCTMNFVTDDFELPSIWKANLAIDHELPWHGIVASAELLMTDVKSGLYYDSLNLGPGYTGPDGRELHWTPTNSNGSVRFSSSGFGRNSNYDYVYLLANTSKGKSQQLTFMLNKPWSVDSDWSWTLGYTYTNVTEVGSLTSSTASSGYSYQHSFNVGENISKNGRYEIKDRFSGSLNWKHAFFGDYETRVGLFYEGRSGRPYSMIFNGDANGDRRSNNDLFYVPSGPGDVLFGTLSGSTTNPIFTRDAAMEASFFSWLAGVDELNAYRGTYAAANAFRAEWVNTFDLRVTQELPGLFKGHKSQVWVDIQNVGNLLNKDWGHILDYGFFGSRRIATLQGMYNGKYVYNYRFADNPAIPTDSDGFTHGISQWSLQVGFKYEF